MTQAKDIPAEEFPIRYRHGTINRASRSLNYRNKLSGHTWSEPEFLNEFEISGTQLFHTRYKTLESAQEAIDFDHNIRWGKFAETQKRSQNGSSGPGM